VNNFTTLPKEITAVSNILRSTILGILKPKDRERKLPPNVIKKKI
jgi:hypothetical protein